jgi:serine/threonine-protein kinase PknG
VVAGLPVPLVDGADPAAGYLTTLAGLEPAEQAQKLLGAVTGDAGLQPGVAESPETRLALARALIGAGDLNAAKAALDELSSAGTVDWRIAWYTGLCELAGGRPDRRARRSAPSTTSCQASSRRSWPSPSPPRPAATWPPRGTTSSSCG